MTFQRIDYKKMKYSAYLAYLEWSNNAHIVPTNNQDCSYLLLARLLKRLLL